MSDVSFNEEQNLTRYASSSAPKKGGISGLLMRWGLAGSESQANKVMIGIIVVALVIMIFIWMPHGSKQSTGTLPTQPVPGGAP